MVSQIFKKVDGVGAQNSLKGEKIDREELGISGGNNDETVITEHVYIVFADEITIESGIEAIQEKVLKGGTLDVSRKDVTGNAIVAIVGSNVRKQIENIPEVKAVKVNEPAEVKKNEETSETLSDETVTGAENSFEDIAEADLEASVADEEIQAVVVGEADKETNAGVSKSLNEEHIAASDSDTYEIYSAELVNEGVISRSNFSTVLISGIVGIIILGAGIFTWGRLHRKNGKTTL